MELSLDFRSSRSCQNQLRLVSETLRRIKPWWGDLPFCPLWASFEIWVNEIKCFIYNYVCFQESVGQAQNSQVGWIQVAVNCKAFTPQQGWSIFIFHNLVMFCEVYLGISKAYTGVWLPLSSRIYERLLTGSELWWGNLDAHKFELEALAAPGG